MCVCDMHCPCVERSENKKKLAGSGSWLCINSDKISGNSQTMEYDGYIHLLFRLPSHPVSVSSSTCTFRPSCYSALELKSKRIARIHSC